MLRRIAADTPLDLEACEFFVRDAVLTGGAGVLRRALECVGRGRRDTQVLCPRCAHRMKSVGLKSKVLCTILGDVLFRRSLFVCPHCHATLFPADRRLGVVHTDFSPGALRMIARAASRVAFVRASEDLAFYANLHVSPKTVERQAERIGEEIEQWMKRQDAEILRLQREDPTPDTPKTIRSSVLYIEYDGTGVPIRRAELAGQKGKQPDGTAITREVKVGCVFTQTTVDDQGRPVRDPHTTTYVGAIEISDAFGRRIYAEALRRDLYRYARVVIIADGARYNRSIFAMHFPGATYIIDIYHAREHLEAALVLLVPEPLRPRVSDQWNDLLDAGDIETLVIQMKERLPYKPEKDKLNAIHYFDENKDAMRYAHFKAKGFFLGSGVIEAGCKTVIGRRMKESGMFWSVSGANKIIALSCCVESRRFEDFWEQRQTENPPK
ncbi:MAG: ISKra4 family transposase [Candidatus Hydrogenedentes bacterium]|nr:ISKra4 family transposase [Candidatus Hydrogenedentota bacterium]